MRIKKRLKDFPEILKEWDYELNGNVNPEEIASQSNRIFYWKCPKGHPSYLRSVGKKTSRMTGCPICSNRVVLEGYNDFASLYPVLASEWDYEKNTLKPSEITYGSNRKIWWKCPNGHDSYLATVTERRHGAGCNICNSIFQTSFPEQAVYYYVKKFFPDAVNKFKKIFNSSMELDIFIPSIKTAIEYDGIAWHNDGLSKKREQKKYALCKENGVTLYRIKEESNDAENADKVLTVPRFSYDDSMELSNAIKTFLHDVTKISDPDVNIERDVFDILLYRVIKRENSFGYLYPEIAKEWHPILNKNLKPENVLPGTTLKVWWMCPKGHEWKASIANRTKGSGCDICAWEKRKITYHNTRLQTRDLLIDCKCVVDWDYSKNKHTPDYYTKGSGDKVWWKCHKCGHEWKTAIVNRTRDYKNGCPACSNRILVKGKNDLLTTNPELAKEWDYEKNHDLLPTDIAQWSHAKVWWKCSKCGYSYEATPSNRVFGKGCGCCAGRIVVPGINDLATTRPDIAIDWHPTKNGDLKPTDVTKGRRDMIWWKCHVCGHEWQDSLNHRNRGRGCSICNKKKKHS